MRKGHGMDLIKKLSDEAKQEVPKGILSVEQWIEEYNRIFATLIVKECANVVVKDMNYYANWCDDKILKHFNLK